MNLHTCSPDQICTVLDTLPLRTVVCKCAEDRIITEDGRCAEITRDKPMCRNDHECSDPDRCYNGACVEACKLDRCGVNAICTSRVHKIDCRCAPGYQGNPHKECTPSMYYLYSY